MPTDKTEQTGPKAGVGKRLRSRSGCTRCRRHRKRCDELKPACTRCQEAGAACSYEINIKWGGRAFPKMLGTYAGRVQRLDNAAEGGGFVYIAQPPQQPGPSSSSRRDVPAREAAAPPVPPLLATPSSPPIERVAAWEDDAVETVHDETAFAGASADDGDDVIDVIDVSRDDAMVVTRQQPAWASANDFLLSPSSSRTVLGQPAYSLDFAPDVPRMHRFLVNHYVHETIRLTAPSSYVRNEICRSVVPMSVDQPCLRYAMMAFAARHLNTLGALPLGTGELPGDDDPEQVIAELEDRSMRHLRQQLTQPNFRQHAVALATTRTLCQSQILAAGTSWRTHLEGARAILQAASASSDEPAAAADKGKRPELASIQDYLASWYNNVEALAALTPLGLRRGQLELGRVVGRRSVCFDVFGGLVSDVPDLFREVGALVMERRRRDSGSSGDNSSTAASILSDADIALEAESLVQDIHARLRQDTIGSLLRRDSKLLQSLSPDIMHDYALSNASFLHTALLYIHCAVQCLPLSAPAVRHSVEQIVWCYGHMKSASSALSPRVLMGTPLFTAGLWAMPDAQAAIRDYFATMGTWMRTPHNVRSSAVLEYVWSKTRSPEHHDVLTYLEESPDFLPY